MMVPCGLRNGVSGKFAVDVENPAVFAVSRGSLRDNLVPLASRTTWASFVGMNDKFEQWCVCRNIGVKYIFNRFNHFPTSFLEQDIFFVVEFQTLNDAMLFRLSWIN